MTLGLILVSTLFSSCGNVTKPNPNNRNYEDAYRSSSTVTSTVEDCLVWWATMPPILPGRLTVIKIALDITKLFLKYLKENFQCYLKYLFPFQNVFLKLCCQKLEINCFLFSWINFLAVTKNELTANSSNLLKLFISTSPDD